MCCTVVVLDDTDGLEEDWLEDWLDWLWLVAVSCKGGREILNPFDDAQGRLEFRMTVGGWGLLVGGLSGCSYWWLIATHSTALRAG